MSTYPPPGDPHDAPGGYPYGAPQQPYPPQYPAQPTYGQPGQPGPYTPQQPQYGQPQQPPPYGQPQPQYGQPQPQYAQRPDPYAELGNLDQNPYPQQAFPPPGAQPPPMAMPEPPPAKKRRRLGCCLGVVGVFLAACGVGAYFLVSTYGDLGTYKLVPPTSFQSLSEDPTNSLVTTFSSSTASLTKIGMTPVNDAYSTKVGDRLPKIAIVGGYGDVAAPGTELNAFWAGLGGDAGNTVAQKTDEPTGSLGGQLQCAIASNTSAGVFMPTCVWVDHSTVVGVIFLGQAAKTAPPASDLATDAATTLALRTAAEVKKQ